MLLGKKKGKPLFELKGFGKLKAMSENNGSEWFGDVQYVSKNHTVELTIEVDNNSAPSINQIEFVKQFSENIESTEQAIYDYIYNCYRGTKWQMTKESVKGMYRLAAVALKRNSDDVWVTLEPLIDVPSIFNIFPRFTLRNNKIVWSNLK